MNTRHVSDNTDAKRFGGVCWFGGNWDFGCSAFVTGITIPSQCVAASGREGSTLSCQSRSVVACNYDSACVSWFDVFLEKFGHDLVLADELSFQTIDFAVWCHFETFIPRRSFNGLFGLVEHLTSPTDEASNFKGARTALIYLSIARVPALLCRMAPIRSFRDRASQTRTRHETLRLATISAELAPKFDPFGTLAKQGFQRRRASVGVELHAAKSRSRIRRLVRRVCTSRTGSVQRRGALSQLAQGFDRIHCRGT